MLKSFCNKGSIKRGVCQAVFLALILLITSYELPVTTPVFASKVDDLKAQIEERNKQIDDIQKEIDAYQKEIDKNVANAKTFKNEIARLETTKKKLTADISLTKKQIEKAELNIESLGLAIQDKESGIQDRQSALAESIRIINNAGDTSFIELILSENNFSEFFGEMQKIEDLQKAVNGQLSELKGLKAGLEDQKTTKEKQKEDLEQYNSKLADQKKLTEINKANKDKLLKQTQSKEAEYKKLLADRLAKQQALEDEISSFEDQIQIEIDANYLPPVGSGVLKWPLDKSSPKSCWNGGEGFANCISQFFGNTAFATANPQIYGGKGHNGLDFRASVGTPVKSSLRGVVRDVGDTDTACDGVSYGKWVLIDHPNNLTTLYAHLSLIKVSAGQGVDTRQILGYSGNTGYSTGPHLHFTVFATKGVNVGNLRSKICGTIMRLPMASYNSYLNPLSYL